MKTHALIERLSVRVEQLIKDIDVSSSEPSTSARFEQTLFQCRSIYLADYIPEVRQNLAQLASAVKHNQLSRVSFLAERLLAQLEALQRELATEQLRKTERTSPTNDDFDNVYQKFAQHQDYERRLAEMLKDRETQLENTVNFSEKNKLQREVVALEGRLSRCRSALGRLEKKIEFLEKE